MKRRPPGSAGRKQEPADAVLFDSFLTLTRGGTAVWAD
ncbi:hypothetical protein KNP414_01088 [Paenibacillus mucilaginosus KNP414]|uniref:Uncharacterized protein n=1 Tax=Paenibacillus mucilaginosus (strain KNP414) TaxID=1036673 RepID=F8FCT4_PAEMK|nr:hypothetical protein KNP414_01088 [Paenibacillus mucilaginosus KNP414]